MKFLRELKIKTLFYMLFAVSTGILVFMALITYNSLSPIKQEWDHYQQDVVQRQALLMDIKAHFGYGGVIHNFKNYVLRGQDKYYSRLQKGYAEVKNLLDEYKSITNISPKEQQALDDIAAVLEQYRIKLGEVKVLQQEGKTPKEIDQAVKINDDPALAGFEVLDAAYMAQTLHSNEALSVEIKDATQATFMSLILAIIFIALVIFAISKVTIKGIYLVKKVIANSQKNNDLSVSIPVLGNNEITELSISFNSLIAHFSQIIARIIKAAANVGIKTTLQSSLVESLVKGVNQQNLEIDLVATAMTEMSATVQEVASNTDHVAHAATQANDEAQTGSQVMTSTIDSMDSLLSRIDFAVEVVTKLENESSEISKVLEVITGISEQTNLLALNAAIEAARAGEQGRGFAVVADEVRALALRTKEAADEINNMISSLQSQVRDAVKVMEDSKKDAGISSTQVESAGQAFTRIVNEIATINDMVLHIASATKEQNQVTEEMSQNIVNISTESHKTVEAGNNTLDATAAISGMIDELRNEASEFKIKDVTVQIVQAKVAHLAWRGRIRSFLDGKSALSDDEAVSHFDCALGKWYYSEGLQQFSDIPEMKEIEKPHAELHATIKRIIGFKKSGHANEAEREYEKINVLSQEVVALLDILESKIVQKLDHKS